MYYVKIQIVYIMYNIKLRNNCAQKILSVKFGANISMNTE